MRNVLVEQHPYRVRIYPRRRRATSVALFSLGFAALGLYCLITFILPAAPDDVSFGAILFVVVTVGLLGPAGLHHGYMVFRHSPILVLDEDGIRDSSSLFSVGFVPWSRVIGCTEYAEGEGQRRLMIRLRDPRGVIARAPAGRRTILRLSTLISGTPMHIPLLLVPLSGADLAAEIAKARQAWTEAHGSDQAT